MSNELLENLLRDKFLSIFAITFTVIYGFAATFLLRKIKERKIYRKNSFRERVFHASPGATSEHEQENGQKLSGDGNSAPHITRACQPAGDVLSIYQKAYGVRTRYIAYHTMERIEIAGI